MHSASVQCAESNSGQTSFYQSRSQLECVRRLDQRLINVCMLTAMNAMYLDKVQEKESIESGTKKPLKNTT